VTFEAKFPEGFGNVIVHSDKHKLEQVVRNFVTNAIKFTPHKKEGKIQVTVDFTSNKMLPVDQRLYRAEWQGRDGGQFGVLRVAITDNGVGISQECSPLFVI
jgi:signal transduction histidine kinase